MTLLPRKGLRRFVWRGHNYTYDGYFHTWSEDAAGQCVAVWEDDIGHIHVEPMIVGIQFWDRA